MSLLDALLLDPYRINIWIAKRTDGIAGSGTMSDPYDGSTATKFDSFMSNIAANTCVNLGPGEFTTLGYCDGQTDGWAAASGMKIVGAGIDVTTLKVVRTTPPTAHHYAVAHPLGSAGTRVDFFEISDLTIDCDVAGAGTNVARGAVRVKGHHARIRRVKVKNWGARDSSPPPCYVLSIITADPDAASGSQVIDDPGIEDCIVVEPYNPGSPASVKPATVFHAGLKEGGFHASAMYGKGPWIRNCFVDCISLNDSSLDAGLYALSMGWCLGGLIEGNQIHNIRTAGPFQSTTATHDVIVRNNYFRNVRYGVFLSATSSSNFSIDRVIIDGNIIELLGTDDEAEEDKCMGIQLLYSSTGQVYGSVLIRDNKIRYVDGVMTPSNTGSGIKVEGAEDVIVENNVVDVIPEDPIRNERCVNVKYFNNTDPGGTLMQGFNEDTDKKYDELETEAEDALLLALLNER